MRLRGNFNERIGAPSGEPGREGKIMKTAKNMMFGLMGSSRSRWWIPLMLAAQLSGQTTPPAPGAVLAWGYDLYGQTDVPSGLSGTVIAIAASGDHSLALKNDGTVVAWGDDNGGESSVPPGLNGVRAIAGGVLHSLALKNDGTVVAWGLNLYGETDVPPGLSGVRAIAGGGFNSLALKDDGTVVVWGWNQYGQTNVPPGLSGVKAIAMGSSHSLALKDDGTVIAWGYNDFGQTDVPPGLTGVIAIAAGGRHNLALKNDGTVVAWGENSFGESDVPSGLTGVKLIAAGQSHSLALKTDGTLVIWGDNTWGQSSIPSGVSGVTAMAAGGFHTLVLVPAPSDTTPPVVTPNIIGTQVNGWYINNVTVSWTVSDSESTITSKTGCDASYVNSDTTGLTLTCVATSAGGTTTRQVTIRRDATAPYKSCGAADGSWHASNVNIACTAGDATSLLANTADASFNLTTSVPAGTENASVSTNSRSIVDNAGNSVNAGPIGGNKIDKKAPSISITSPAATSYTLNQTVAANYSCSDGGSGVNSCAGPVASGANINTASPGSKTFTVNAADKVGNAGSASAAYSVNYNFSGYLAPVSNPPTVNTGKPGKIYPVKWQLRDANGRFISALSAITSVTYQSTACPPANAPTGSLGTGTTGSNGLRYDSATNQYVYNWSAPKTAGCYTLQVKLDSGQTFPAYFNLSN
jgi:hypothetical protein